MFFLNSSYFVTIRSLILCAIVVFSGSTAKMDKKRTEREKKYNLGSFSGGTSETDLFSGVTSSAYLSLNAQVWLPNTVNPEGLFKLFYRGQPVRSRARSLAYIIRLIVCIHNYTKI